MSVTAIQALGKRLREERKRLGFTQVDFAALVEKQRLALIKYETGKTSPTLDFLLAAGNVGADMYYILTGARIKELEDFRAQRIAIQDQVFEKIEAYMQTLPVKDQKLSTSEFRLLFDMLQKQLEAATALP